VWCSGRGGSRAAGGRGFESRRPRCCEIYAKNARDGRALASGGLHRLKKIPFFLVKIPIFFGFFSVPTLPSVLPSARQKTLDKDAFADAFFAEWSLPSAALGKAFAECSTRQRASGKKPVGKEFLPSARHSAKLEPKKKAEKMEKWNFF